MRRFLVLFSVLLFPMLHGADTTPPPSVNKDIRIPDLAAVPPATDAQRQAMKDVSRQIILGTSRELFIAQGIADTLDQPAPTWETVQNDAIEAALHSPRAAGLPFEFTDSLRRKAKLNERVVSTLATGNDSDRKLADFVAEKIREQEEFHNAYVKRETGISLPDLTLRINSFLEISLQDIEQRFGDYPDLVDLDRQFTRQQDEGDLDDAQQTLKTMLGHMFRLAEKSLESPLEATPGERAAILRYCDESFIKLALAQIRNPQDWTDTARQMAALNALEVDESALPVDLQVLLNKERKIRHDIIPLAKQESENGEDADTSALDARFDELGDIQQKTGDYMRRMVGMTQLQAHNLAHQKLMLGVGDKVEAARCELGLPQGDASSVQYLKTLSPNNLQQLQTTALRLLLQDWEKNGIPD